MPSDHAIYFIALASAFYFRARWLGIAAGVWSLLIGLAPRVYFGQHYPSDIVIGAVIGVLVAVAAMNLPLPDRLLDLPGRLASRFPAPFYALAMLVMLEMATMFFETRAWMHRAGLAFHALHDTPAQIAAPERLPVRLEASQPATGPPALR